MLSRASATWRLFLYQCRADTVMQLFEVVRSTPVSFPGEVPASAALQDLLLGMLEKVGRACFRF